MLSIVKKVWDPSSALTWQHAFSVSGVTLAANRLPKPGKTHSRRVSQCCAFTNNSESQEAHSIRIFQVETCRGLACHSVIFVNFVWDIAMHEFGPVSIIHMEDCPFASMLQPT